MAEWIEQYKGHSKLGVERGHDYRGYVVKVRSADDGLPERWFTYAYDQEGGHHFWIGMTNSETAAKGLLELLLSEGWKCEVYDHHSHRHCRDRAVTVKYTLYRRQGKVERLRMLLCKAHEHVHQGWERMTIPEYTRTYQRLEQDAPIMGPRR